MATRKRRVPDPPIEYGIHNLGVFASQAMAAILGSHDTVFVGLNLELEEIASVESLDGQDLLNEHGELLLSNKAVRAYQRRYKKLSQEVFIYRAASVDVGDHVFRVIRQSPRWRGGSS